MKLHTLLAGAAALAFATGAMAEDAATPAAPDSATAQPAPTDMATPDAAASTGAAANAAATITDTATAAAPTDQSTTTAAAPAPTDAASAAAAPAQTGAANAQSAMNAPSADPAKAQAADQMIAQNWSKYDAGNKGQLTPLEFGSWVLAAQGNDMTAQVEKSRHSRAAGLPSTKVLNATSAEFSKADTNKDRQVSQDELKAYLAG